MNDLHRSSTPRYSVVLPVFNEGANVGEFCRRAVAELPPGYELLVCYDFDEDDTLHALTDLPGAQKPRNIRLVKNDRGPGVRFAIEAGMRAARAPVVVVMMAGLADDFSCVEPMVSRVEDGCDVVASSRYMRGGRQIGGRWVKGLVSRLAGVSLRWIAGLPVKGGTKLDQMAEENQTTWPLGRVSENGCAKGGVRMVERQRRGGRACCVRDDSCRRSAPGCGRDESADRAARQSAVRSRRSRSIR